MVSCALKFGYYHYLKARKGYLCCNFEESAFLFWQVHALVISEHVMIQYNTIVKVLKIPNSLYARVTTHMSHSFAQYIHVLQYTENGDSKMKV